MHFTTALRIFPFQANAGFFPERTERKIRGLVPSGFSTKLPGIWITIHVRGSRHPGSLTLNTAPKLDKRNCLVKNVKSHLGNHATVAIRKDGVNCCNLLLRNILFEAAVFWILDTAAQGWYISSSFKLPYWNVRPIGVADRLLHTQLQCTDSVTGSRTTTCTELRSVRSRSCVSLFML